MNESDLMSILYFPFIVTGLAYLCYKSNGKKEFDPIFLFIVSFIPILNVLITIDFAKELINRTK